MSSLTLSDAGSLFARPAFRIPASRRGISFRIPAILRRRAAILPSQLDADFLVEAEAAVGRAALALLPVSFLAWVFVAN
jgi:hypothetical protein